MSCVDESCCGWWQMRRRRGAVSSKITTRSGEATRPLGSHHSSARTRVASDCFSRGPGASLIVARRLLLWTAGLSSPRTCWPTCMTSPSSSRRIGCRRLGERDHLQTRSFSGCLAQLLRARTCKLPAAFSRGRPMGRSLPWSNATNTFPTEPVGDTVEIASELFEKYVRPK